MRFGYHFRMSIETKKMSGVAVSQSTYRQLILPFIYVLHGVVFFSFFFLLRSALRCRSSVVPHSIRAPRPRRRAFVPPPPLLF